RNNAGNGAAAVGFSEEFFRSEFFRSMCRRESMPVDAVARALEPLAVHSPASIEREARVFAWMHEDLVAGARKDASLHGFGVHLTEMYEEIGLLYRLGRSMNQIARPEDFVENACADLQQSTSFRWVAARFVASARSAAGVAGELILSGSLPCDVEDFDREAE